MRRPSAAGAVPGFSLVGDGCGRGKGPRRPAAWVDVTSMRITWTSASVGRRRPLTERLQITDERPRCVFVFAAASTDLDELARELAALGVPVIACTTAGQIGREGFEEGDLTAVAVFDDLDATSFVIPSLAALESSVALMANEIERSGILRTPDVGIFGVLLVDGLAGAEERLMAELHGALPQLPVVGGSAGDDLAFSRTTVFHDGAFRENAAVLHILTTRRRITALKVQHHVPTSHRMVITSATPASRTVHEINGLPAAEAYATAIGVSCDVLTDAKIAQHPLILRIGDEHYIRSVRAIRPDGSLELFCAIETGLVLRLGESTGIVEALETTFAKASADVGEPVLVLGLDCILRRLEIQRAGLTSRVGQLLAANNVIGFSTFGEQYNAVHTNQTFTGFMLGGMR